MSPTSDCAATAGLPALLRQLLFGFLPSVLMGLLGLLLDETSRLCAHLARLFRPSPPPPSYATALAASASEEPARPPPPLPPPPYYAASHREGPPQSRVRTGSEARSETGEHLRSETNAERLSERPAWPQSEIPVKPHTETPCEVRDETGLETRTEKRVLLGIESARAPRGEPSRLSTSTLPPSSRPPPPPYPVPPVAGEGMMIDDLSLPGYLLPRHVVPSASSSVTPPGPLVSSSQSPDPLPIEKQSPSHLHPGKVPPIPPPSTAPLPPPPVTVEAQLASPPTGPSSPSRTESEARGLAVTGDLLRPPPVESAATPACSSLTTHPSARSAPATPAQLPDQKATSDTVHSSLNITSALPSAPLTAMPTPPKPVVTKETSPVSSLMSASPLMRPPPLAAPPLPSMTIKPTSSAVVKPRLLSVNTSLTPLSSPAPLPPIPPVVARSLLPSATSFSGSPSASLPDAPSLPSRSTTEMSLPKPLSIAGDRHPVHPSQMPVKQQKPVPARQSLVAQRINAFESFLVCVEAENDAPLKLPLPASPPDARPAVPHSSPHWATTANPTLPISPLPGSLAECHVSPRRAVELSEPSPALASSHPSFAGLSSPNHSTSRARLEACLSTNTCEIAEETRELNFRDPGDIEEALDEGDRPLQDLLVDVGLDGDTGIASRRRSIDLKRSKVRSSEAPAGADCLQELIPDVIHDARSNSSPKVITSPLPAVESDLFPTNECPGELPEMPEISLDDETIVAVESMEHFPSFSFRKRDSDMSLKTESYSSPDSPVHSSPLGSSSQVRNRESWRASDHDLFSEDPLMSCDDIEESQLGTGKRIRSNGSSSLGDSGGVNSRIAVEYDSAKLLSGRRYRRSSSEDNLLSASTPVTDPNESSWQKRFVQVDSFGDRRRPQNTPKSTRAVPENLLFRQASLDVTALSSARTTPQDRPRAGRVGSWSIMNRFTPSQLSSKASAITRSDRHVPGGLSRRSISTNGHRFDDWPEYAPSTAEDLAKPSRHKSDMSYGAKDRKMDMLPVELLNSGRREDNFPARFGGAGRNNWKRYNGASAAEDFPEHRPKGVLSSILRRRRKGSDLDETFRNRTLGNGSMHRGFENLRKGGGREREFKFELSMSQEASFEMLHNLCPSCGFNIIVSRANYKMKIEVPFDGQHRPLLASITLNSLSHGRGCMVSMTRSKEDQSGGPVRDIHAAGRLLHERMTQQTEFLDDSFPSLVLLEDSAIELRDNGILARG